MLGKVNAIPMVAVKDLVVARKFYEGALSLQKLEATAVTWVVGEEIEELVRALKAKGVVFEHYDDIPKVTRHGDLHISGNRKIAWFKDPDGNILNIVNRGVGRLARSKKSERLGSTE